MENIKSRSNAWYLLPILVGLIGGIIAYLILRRDDPAKAKKCLFIGAIFAVIGIAINVLLISQIPGLTPDFNVNV